MNGRRRTRSSKPPPSEFERLLENLHGSAPENLEQDASAAKQQTLAEASKSDVDKLLDRAGIRGGTAKEQANKLANNSKKRGRKDCLLEGQASLFYQRKVRQNNRISEDSLVCGTGASTLKDVMYGTSHGDVSISNDSLKMAADAAAICLANSETNVHTKSEDASENLTLMEEGCEWEQGSSSIANGDRVSKLWTGDISIEVDVGTPETLRKKSKQCASRRATAKDKEFADTVHKAHLLCLIARGRLVDAACDDPLLQASILSVIPAQLCASGHVAASDLEPFVHWFHKTFQISTDKPSSSFSTTIKDDLTSLLFYTLHTRAGSSEAVAALSVSLLRALGFTTRYVTVLDVLPLKPNALSLEASADWDMPSGGMASMVEDVLEDQHNIQNCALNLGKLLASCCPQSLSDIASTEIASEEGLPSDQYDRKNLEKERTSGKVKGKIIEDPSSSNCNAVQKSKNPKIGSSSRRKDSQIIGSEEEKHNSEKLEDSEIQETKEKVKRKGDLEFELQLAMAMAATAAGDHELSDLADSDKVVSSSKLNEDDVPQNEKSGRFSVGNTKAQSMPRSLITGGSSNTATVGGAIWSRKMGPLLHWAEVYCGGNEGGKWVHIDGGRGLLDAVGIVEGAATACKMPLCYVVAFAGSGAKDVTRRYVTQWSALAPLRVSSDWWSATLAPLYRLEAAATSNCEIKPSFISMTDAKREQAVACGDKSSDGLSSFSRSVQMMDRASLEDMELEIKAYTEPLPKNQQAYRNHHLYVLERWLTKYQILYPRGPILGYCAGHPVFPRSCVQTLHTRERWLREGYKVKSEEPPAKIVASSHRANKQGSDANADNTMVDGSSNETATTSLFGKWQTEPWHPPAAVGGIVPKNERGNVELWSAKCLPSGTVHISLPRILPLAKKLEIDFAPAMVGYEIRNRKTVPVFEGIVVCKEYEALLLEAYAEEEHWRNVQNERRREEQAISKWCQLLRAVATRQRLQDAYQGSHSTSAVPNNNYDADVQLVPTTSKSAGSFRDETNVDVKPSCSIEDHTPHEHSYPEENQSYNELTGVRTKTCPCGFVLTVEEM